MIFSSRHIVSFTLAASFITLLTACSKPADNTASTTPAASAPSAETVVEAPAPAEVTSEESSTYEEGVPGGVKQRISTLTATVKAVDYQKRTLTLDNAEGREITITAPAEAVNFPQIQQGDRINIEYVEQVIISLKDPADAVTENSAEATISRAPEGSKPELVVAGNQVTTATVTAINVEARTAMLQFADGSVREVNVRPDIELKAEQVGREVIFETSQFLMLKVEKASQ